MSWLLQIVLQWTLGHMCLFKVQCCVNFCSTAKRSTYVVQSLNHVQFFVTPWNATCQVPLFSTVSWSLETNLCPLSQWCYSILYLIFQNSFPFITRYWIQFPVHTVWPCLSALYIIFASSNVKLQSIPPPPSSPLATTSLFSIFVSLFLFGR